MLHLGEVPCEEYGVDSVSSSLSKSKMMAMA